MSVDSSSMASHQSFSDFVRTHQGLVLGGGVVLVLVIAGAMFRKQTSAPASSATGDLSGLAGGNLVYVPTQTSFTTVNKQQQGVFATADPNLTSIQTGTIGTTTTTTVNKPTTTTTTTTTTNNPPPVVQPKPPAPPPPPPPRQQPPPHPVPVTQKGLIWDQRYTVRGGDTLSGIAAQYTRTLRAQGMPGSMTLTWNDIYGHNSGTIITTSNAHGNPIPGGPWNNIFPGELLIMPRWG